MDDNSPRRYSEVATLCLRRFREIENEIRRPNDLHLNLSVSSVSDEMDRFRRWAGNIGAVHIPSQPDAALEDRKVPADISINVLQFLESIAGDLNSGERSSRLMKGTLLILLVLQIASGRRVNRVGYLYPRLLSLPARIFLSSSKRILLGLPDRIRSHLSPRIREADFPEVHEMAKTVSEIHELFGTCQEIMSCLFRISRVIPKIPNTARYDISAHLASQRGDQDDRLLDIAFVRQQFPKVRATPWLEKRLGLAVTIRKESIRYGHELHKAYDGEVILHEGIPVGSLILVPLEERSCDDGKPLATSFSEAHCVHEAPSSSVYDESTAPDIARLAISLEPNDGKSPDAPHGTSESIPKTAVASLCPPLPKEGEDGARFYCPYCWTIKSFQATAERTQELWKWVIVTSIETCG